MAVRRILAMKRAALQSRIDALSAQEAGLTRELARLESQGDGLSEHSDDAGFQIAAMAENGARRIALRLECERAALREQVKTLARERLSLDMADTKLEREEKRAAKLVDSRADLRGY